MATATARKRAAKKKPAKAERAAPTVALPALPPVGIARFKEATHLLEHLMDEKVDVFLSKMVRYQDRKREVTSRPLNHIEASQVAAALAEQLGEQPLDLAVQVQQSELRASDPASPAEFLLAAGLSTAPEFLDAAMNFVALVEMGRDEFQQARQDGTGALRDRIREAAAAIMDADPPVAEMRARAGAAFAHFATAGGEDPGKAVGLIKDLIGRALKTAMEQSQRASSGPLPLTVSPSPTGGDSES